MTTAAPRATSPAWVITAVVAGALAGVFAATLAVGGAYGALSVAVALVIIAAVVWRFEIGVVLIIPTLALDEFGRVLTSPATVTVFHLALLLTLFSWFVSTLWRNTRIRVGYVEVGMGALILAALWSLPTSYAPSATIVAIIRLVALLLFTTLYSNALRDRRVAHWVTLSLVGTGVGSALLAIVQYFVTGFTFGSIRMINEGGGVYLRRVGALFADPNFLATFLAIAFVAAAVQLVHSRKRAWAVLWTAACGVLLLGVAVTFSRTAIIGIAVSVIAIVITAPRRRRMGLAALGTALVLLIIILAPGQLIDRVTSITEVGYNDSSATRYYMIGSTVEMARDKWVFGSGLAAFDRAYPPYRRLGSLATILKPHQLPLAMVAEMGIAGLFAELILMACVVAVLWRRRPKGWGVYEAFAVAGLAGVLVQSLFQYYLYFEYLWLIVAFAAAGPGLAIEEESSE